jgi:hypothetical protein
MCETSENETERFTEKKYYRGRHSYHERENCANQGVHPPETTSLIEMRRADMGPCGKCNPPDPPTEFAVCRDCGWQCPIEECEREKGYKGACPACGSPKTTSAFREEANSP